MHADLPRRPLVLRHGVTARSSRTRRRSATTASATDNTMPTTSGVWKSRW